MPRKISGARLVSIGISGLAIGLLAGITVVHFLRAAKPVELNLRKVEPNLTEIELVHGGNGNLLLNFDVIITWKSGTLVDAQALTDFQRIDSGDKQITFHPLQAGRPAIMHTGDPPRAIGWIRLSDDSNVEAFYKIVPGSPL